MTLISREANDSVSGKASPGAVWKAEVLILDQDRHGLGSPMARGYRSIEASRFGLARLFFLYESAPLLFPGNVRCDATIKVDRDPASNTYRSKVSRPAATETILSSSSFSFSFLSFPRSRLLSKFGEI